jgi:3-deoxy-D-manno-octulosonate 8-phosphate phosphatase (KDO 8-P phosphatase)
MNNLPQIVFTDIDGVWTDGGIYYDAKGNEQKKFNTSDSAAVLFLKELNIPLVIITGEKTDIVKKRAEKLKIEHVLMGITNKLDAATNICRSLNIDLKNTAFIGDDIMDIPLLKETMYSACPNNSPDYVKMHCKWILSKNGGEGAFREFIEKILIENNLLESVIEKVLKKYSDEK